MIHPWDQDLLNAIWWMAGLFFTATLLAAIAIGIQTDPRLPRRDADTAWGQAMTPVGKSGAPRTRKCAEPNCGRPIEYLQRTWWHVEPNGVDDPHPALRYPPDPPRCTERHTVGSYPGDESFHCELPPGHEGDHESKVYWETTFEEAP